MKLRIPKNANDPNLNISSLMEKNGHVVSGILKGIFTKNYQNHGKKMIKNVTFDIKRQVDMMLETINECLVTLCKLRRSMEELTAINISNSLQEFKMLDKLAQKCEMADDLEGLGDCHYLMVQIVTKLEPVHEQLFEQYPEFKEIFLTFKRNYHG